MSRKQNNRNKTRKIAKRHQMNKMARRLERRGASKSRLVNKFEMPSIQQQMDISYYLENLIESGKADCIFGSTGNGIDYWFDLEAGKVEITYPDGKVEVMSDSDPRAKAILCAEFDDEDI